MPVIQRTKRAPSGPPTMPPEGVADNQLAIDGFTWGEIRAMATDSVVTARCVYCQDEREVEADAEKYDCYECGGAETITSPLVKLGLI